MHFGPSDIHRAGRTPLSIVPPSGCGSCAKTEQEDKHSTALRVMAVRDPRNIMTSIF
jgi:hypothetical protein